MFTLHSKVFSVSIRNNYMHKNLLKILSEIVWTDENVCDFTIFLSVLGNVFLYHATQLHTTACNAT